MVNYEGLLSLIDETQSMRFGLLSQQNSPTGDILHSAFKGRLACLFSPEHGWYGLAGPGEKTDDARHHIWNIRIHSLYGEHRHPTPEMLHGLDRIVIDLQDLGVRCYTYLATLKNMLEACAEAQIPVTVLDRPIPLGGVVDGPRRDLAFSSFVAPIDVPLCHGMTPGECATYLVCDEDLNLDLTIVKQDNWSHSTRIPWPNFMPPSPAIRNWDCAALYPATVFTEAYPAIDCDREGPLAFRVLGAPWMDPLHILHDVAGVLPSCGLGARSIRYRPAGGKYAGQIIDGILLSVEQPDAFYPVTGGTLLFDSIWRRHPEEMQQDARPEWLDKLSGSTALREALRDDTVNLLLRKWFDDQEAYMPRRVNLY